MEKKSPVGIFVYGVLFLLSGIISWVLSLPLLRDGTHYGFTRSMEAIYGQLGIIFATAGTVLMLLGIFTLIQRFRRLIIVLLVVIILFDVTFVLWLWKHCTNWGCDFVTVVGMSLGIAIPAAFFGSAINYFTRPKVKEQFKR